MRKLRIAGLLTIALTVALDQISKAAILDLFADPATSRRHVEIVQGLFDLVLWWNPGVSFGLLNRLSPAAAPYLLTALAALVCLWLAIMLWRSDAWPKAAATGLVIGGAIGNVIDRLRFGAVVDFLYIHQGDWYWPAFNLADSAICMGVVLLLAESLWTGHKKPSPDGENPPK